MLPRGLTGFFLLPMADTLTDMKEHSFFRCCLFMYYSWVFHLAITSQVRASPTWLPFKSLQPFLLEYTSTYLYMCVLTFCTVVYLCVNSCIVCFLFVFCGLWSSFSVLVSPKHLLTCRQFLHMQPLDSSFSKPQGDSDIQFHHL